MKEVAEKLKMKSVNAVARWCIDNKIEIMSFGNKRLVSEFDFKLFYEKPIIDMLKRKYGDNWPVYYEVYKSEDVKKYYELELNMDVTDHNPIAFNTDTFLNEIGYGKSKDS